MGQGIKRSAQHPCSAPTAVRNSGLRQQREASLSAVPSVEAMLCCFCFHSFVDRLA